MSERESAVLLIAPAAEVMMGNQRARFSFT